jgi:hypothetical protein
MPENYIGESIKSVNGRYPFGAKATDPVEFGKRKTGACALKPDRPWVVSGPRDHWPAWLFNNNPMPEKHNQEDDKDYNHQKANDNSQPTIGRYL